jgi:multiple sugar transport system permease protein
VGIQNKHTARVKPVGIRRDGLTAFLFLSPTLILFGTFIVFPVIFSFYLSFHKWNMFSTEQTFIGFANYTQLLRSPDFWQVFRNTVVYTLGTVPVNMVLALAVAYLLNKKLVGKKFLRTAFFTPVIISWIAAAVIWRWLFEPNYGLINYVLGFFGVSPINWLNDPTMAMIALIIVGVWKTFGFNMILFSAGLQSIPEHYYEAAEIDGAGKLSQFWNITLPLLSPTTFFIVIMSVIGSFQVFDAVYVLTSGGPLGSTKVMIFYIYENAFKFFNMGYASALAYVLFAVIFMLTLLQFKILSKRVHYS